MRAPLPTNAPKLINPRFSRGFSDTGAGNEMVPVVGTVMAFEREKVDATMAARAAMRTMLD